MQYTLKILCTQKENQIFDRKSARKAPKGLPNHNEVINDKNEVINDTLSDNEQILFNVISANPNITKLEMKAQTNLSMSTIDRNIKSLKEKGILQRVGSNKAGNWIVTR